MAKVITKPDEIEDDVKEEVNEEEVKERKANKFFHYYKNAQDFTITIYRIKERGKRAFVDKFENSIPDLVDVKRNYGSGQYEFYAHDFSGKLKDTATIYIDENPIINTAVKNDENLTEEKFIQKIALYKSILGENQGNNNSEVLLKIMETQQKIASELSKVISDNNERVMKAMIESERRMIELTSNKRSDLSDIKAMIEFIDDLRPDNRPEEKSLLENVLTSPITQNILTGLMAPSSTPVSLPEAPKKLSSFFPTEFIAKLNRETRQKAIEAINQKINNLTESEKIIDELLKEKGL